MKIKGTYPFIAPEIFKECIYSFKSDVYAFGILLYEMIVKKSPFENYEKHKIIHAVVNNKRAKIGKNVPTIYKNLIESYWHQDPNKRPDFNSIVRDLLTDPEYRKGIDESYYQSYIEYIYQRNQKESFKKYNLNRFYADMNGFIDYSFSSSMMKFACFCGSSDKKIPSNHQFVSFVKLVWILLKVCTMMASSFWF